jgi:hypothetical protein
MTVQTKKSKFAPTDLLVEDLITDIKFNPLKSKHLDQWTLSQQREMAGLLPRFFLSAWYDIEGDLTDNDTAAVISVEELFTKLKTGVSNKYHYGSGFINDALWKKGNVNYVGLYTYPTDPDLYPVVTLSISACDYENNEWVPVIACHIYESGMIAIRNQVSGEWDMTRMD